MVKELKLLPKNELVINQHLLFLFYFKHMKIINLLKNVWPIYWKMLENL